MDTEWTSNNIVAISIGETYIGVCTYKNGTQIVSQLYDVSSTDLGKILLNPSILKVYSNHPFEFSKILNIKLDLFPRTEVRRTGSYVSELEPFHLKISPFLNETSVGHSYQHICEYAGVHLKKIDIIQLKDALIDAGMIEDQEERLKTLGTIMLTVISKIYKFPSDDPIFNSKRECYLSYLTAYNDILIRYGPLPFVDLVNKVRTVCRGNICPSEILVGLIKTGAFKSDPMTAIVSLPDIS